MQRAYRTYENIQIRPFVKVFFSAYCGTRHLIHRFYISSFYRSDKNRFGSIVYHCLEVMQRLNFCRVIAGAALALNSNDILKIISQLCNFAQVLLGGRSNLFCHRVDNFYTFTEGYESYVIFRCIKISVFGSSVNLEPFRRIRDCLVYNVSRNFHQEFSIRTIFRSRSRAHIDVFRFGAVYQNSDIFKYIQCGFMDLFQFIF